jgi:uncharacterized protein DUF4262
MADKMLKWIKKQIKQEGFAIIDVFPDGPNQDWFHYTVGNHSRGLPEILVIGGDQRTAGPLSSLTRIMHKRNAAFAGGELVSMGGKHPVKVVNANCAEVHDLYTCAVGRHYETESYLVQQMLIPDRDGRYPDDPLCTEPYASLRVCNRHGMPLSWAYLQGASLN